MPQEKPERPLILARRHGRSDHLRELRIPPPPAQDRLSVNPCRRGRLAEGFTRSQGAENQPHSPVQFHTLKLSKTAVPVPVHGLAAACGRGMQHEIPGAGFNP